jgi:2-methylcitrate dehydratase PrpD
VNPALNPKLGYTPRDLLPVTRITTSPLVMAVGAQTSYRSVGDVIAAAKKDPGKLNYSTSGNGSAPHLAMALFNQLTGTQMVHVPYKGGAPAIQAVMAGETELTFGTSPSVLPHASGGKLRVLAVSTRERSPLVPDLPGMREAGLPEYDLEFWYGIFVPAGTPPAIVRKIFDAASKAMQQPSVKAILAREGTDVSLSASPEQFAAYLVDDGRSGSTWSRAPTSRSSDRWPRPTSPARSRATWSRRAIACCRPMWRARLAIASSTRSPRSSPARRSSRARWRSVRARARRRGRGHGPDDRHPHDRDQRGAGERDVRPRRRDRRLRADDQGASRLLGRAGGARDGRARSALGRELVNAVALGYDVGCRLLMALGPGHVRATHRSAEGTSSTFGAVAAAAAAARLDETGMRHALSYAAQQVSGIWSWVRDPEHVEKAFDFSGMGARNGVTAAVMVQMGFSGVWDVLDGEHNALIALSAKPDPAQMVAGLGSRFYVAETAIKPHSVGYPIQAPLDALLTLIRAHGLKPDDVASVLARLPEDGAKIVDDRSMPDVNCQHILAVALVDGDVSFHDSHSYERMQDPAVRAVRQRVRLVADPALMDPAAPRSGHVEVTLRDGRTVSHFTRHAPGTKENPLDTQAVSAKARRLMAPVLGDARTEDVVRHVLALESLADVRELTACLGAAARAPQGLPPLRP